MEGRPERVGKMADGQRNSRFGAPTSQDQRARRTMPGPGIKAGRLRARLPTLVRRIGVALAAELPPEVIRHGGSIRSIRHDCARTGWIALDPTRVRANADEWPLGGLDRIRGRASE